MLQLVRVPEGVVVLRFLVPAVMALVGVAGWG